jgi:hypothetical protein
MSILTNEKYVASLHEGFDDAQATCAQLVMKPMKTSPRCWWTTPWKHERHMEAQLYRDMGEEECDINHVLGSARPCVVDERRPIANDIDVEPIVDENEENPLQLSISSFVEVDRLKFTRVPYLVS